MSTGGIDFKLLIWSFTQKLNPLRRAARYISIPRGVGAEYNLSRNLQEERLMSDLREELLKQDDFSRQIASLRSAQKAHAVRVIKQLMEINELTFTDIAKPEDEPKPPVKPVRGRRPAGTKYRDEQGHQWSGRGLKPKWLQEALRAGRRLEEFLV